MTRELIVLALVVVAAGSTQQPAARTLTTPEARLSQPMVQILSGVRELSDGSVMLIDNRERRVYHVDRTLSRAVAVGRFGSGPGEYTQPVAVLPLPGDTTLIRDGGNGSRLLVVTPSGTPERFLSATGLTAPPDPRSSPSSITALDARGNYFSTTRPSIVSPGTRDSGDTLAIVRWSRSDPAIQLIAFLPTEPRYSSPMSVNGMRAYLALDVPFRSRPQWAVSSDGRVAIAHHTPYRIEIFDTAGRRTVNSSPSTPRIRVTEAHRKQWLAGYNARAEEDRRTGGEYPPVGDWPEFLPAFLLDAIRFDPAGRLWIHRTGSADATPRYDVIDGNGRIAFVVALPAWSRVVGFGANGAVYLARADDAGFEYLERYQTVDGRR